MRSKNHRRRAAAIDASLLLVQDALVQIRAMAYLRKDLSPSDAHPPSDYHQRIRLIADVCENLPGHLRASTRGTPEQGLQYAWDTANDIQRQWMQETLARQGVNMADIIATSSGTAE